MRPSKEEYYLNIARVVASRSTCLRRNYGAVIVKNDRIISTGYNGAPRNDPNCCDIGTCKRIQNHVPHNTGDYSDCCSVHAEQNAIIHANYEDMRDAVMYLVGIDPNTNALIPEISCCPICHRMAKNAGLASVVTPYSHIVLCGKSVNEFLQQETTDSGISDTEEEIEQFEDMMESSYWEDYMAAYYKLEMFYDSLLTAEFIENFAYVLYLKNMSGMSAERIGIEWNDEDSDELIRQLNCCHLYAAIDSLNVITADEDVSFLTFEIKYNRGPKRLYRVTCTNAFLEQIEPLFAFFRHKMRIRFKTLHEDQTISPELPSIKYMMDHARYKREHK